MIPLPFRLALARRRGRALVPLAPSELRALLPRREQILVAEERAAVQAALDSATPEERRRLEGMLRTATPGRSAPAPR